MGKKENHKTYKKRRDERPGRFVLVRKKNDEGKGQSMPPSKSIVPLTEEQIIEAFPGYSKPIRSKKGVTRKGQPSLPKKVDKQVSDDDYLQIALAAAKVEEDNLEEKLKAEEDKTARLEAIIAKREERRQKKQKAKDIERSKAESLVDGKK
ncbi:hypothetical protein ADUPG1_013944 [Aduncisulcus paluster]|uniref:Uncharacterized protein n=1 Tax=Aduncisulcus paluster TaxID=2918883 RepID=A0ABQ5K4Y8_9EUKA|nr:hypothetical protein ADUPG1_013944 [Aduncisulcus paluster]